MGETREEGGHTLKKFALCLFGGFLYKHSLIRRQNARSSGDEEGGHILKFWGLCLQMFAKCPVKRKRALGISLPVLSSYDKGENYELF